MSSTVSNAADMMVQNSPLNLPFADKLSQSHQKFLEPQPQIVVNMEVEEPPQLHEAKENQFRSVFGQSDMLSVLEDRNDWDKDPSEHEGKYKSTRRCFNQKCSTLTPLRKLKSRAIPNKYRNFCPPCYEYYINNQYCEFCEQVYDLQAFNEEDDNNWIGCDSCERWNHISCQIQKRSKNVLLIKQENKPYFCKQCSNEKDHKVERVVEPKKHKVQLLEDDYYQYERSVKKRTARQICKQEKDQKYVNSNPNCVNVFGKERQFTLYLDGFLQAAGYKLAISEMDIREDMRRMKEVVGREGGLGLGLGWRMGEK